MMRSSYDYQLYTFVLYIKACNKVYIRIIMEILILINSGRAHEVSHYEVILFTLAAPFKLR